MTSTDSQTADPVVRAAVAADAQRVAEIVQQAYGVYLDRLRRPPAPMLQDHAAAIDRRGVWVTGEPVVGVLCLVPSEDTLLIENVAVAPAHQGTGVGRVLLLFAEQQAREAGLDATSLYTNELMHENIDLYTRIGYQEIGRRTDSGYRRVFMRKTLR